MKYGNNYLKKKQLTHELAEINKELRRLRTQIAGLEHRKAALLASLAEEKNSSTSTDDQAARRHPAGSPRPAAKGQTKKRRS
jgi:predicted  nucleic acid-binding Zn-ribbon protein